MKKIDYYLMVMWMLVGINIGLCIASVITQFHFYKIEISVIVLIVIIGAICLFTPDNNEQKAKTKALNNEAKLIWNFIKDCQDYKQTTAWITKQVMEKLSIDEYSARILVMDWIVGHYDWFVEDLLRGKTKMI